MAREAVISTLRDLKPLRILLIADVPDNRSGGMSRTMHATGDALLARGHQVDFLFHDAFRYQGRPQLRRFYVPREIPELVRQQVRERGPYDVVEVHEPLAAVYAWHRQRDRSLPPLVVFSYGLEERSHPALLRYRKLKQLPVSLKNRWSPLTVVWQARYAVRQADHVICSNSEDVQHLISAGVAPERLTRHHSGVEREFLMAGASLQPVPPRSILFFGSWLMRKGILDLIPAVTKILRTQPEVSLTVGGCGASETQVRESFPMDVRARIKVIPEVSGNDRLIELYRQHQILVLPSFFEGQPLVMIEAAALKLAIITTRVCGMLDFIQDGQNGLFTEVGDATQLTAHLEKLLLNPDLTHQLGEAAYQTACTHTWEAAALKLEAAYRQACGR